VLARRAEIAALVEQHSVAAITAELAARFPGFALSRAFVADLSALELTQALKGFTAAEIEDARAGEYG
jgi:hypothetical protein